MKQTPENGASKEHLIEEQAYKTAIEAAIRASNLILPYWPNLLNTTFDKKLVNKIFEKEGVGNYSTIADNKSEEVIKQTIRRQSLLKNHSIMGEEKGEVTGDRDWVWIVDPIDGTLNFNNGSEMFGISISLFKEGKPAIGVIALPASKRFIAARKDRGATLESFDGKTKIDLATLENGRNTKIDKALVAFDLSYSERGEQLKNVPAKIADKIGYPPCYASLSWSNSQIAQGSLHGYFSGRPTWYDIGAALTIIPETGGVATDRYGNPIKFNNGVAPSYLAARTPELHKQLLRLVNE